jgi:hypothetical protein
VRITLLLLLFVWTQALGNTPQTFQNYRVIHNYANEWLMYDREEEMYVPYRQEIDQELNSFSLKVETSRFPKAYLLIKTGEKTCNIFLDKALERVSGREEWIVYNLDSLKRQYRKDFLYLNILSASAPEDVVAYIGYPSGLTAEVKDREGIREVVRLLPRNVSRINSGVAIAFLLGLVVMSFVSTNYFRVFGKYFSLREVLSTRVKENLFMVGKPLDRPNLFFVILLSVMVGIFFLLLENGGFSIIEGNFLFQRGNTFAVYTINFFKTSLIVFGLYVLKFFFLNVVGKLFNLGKVTDLHFFKVVQCSVFFFTLLTTGSLFLYNTYIPLPQSIDNYLFIIFIAFFLFRVILIYFTINRESNVKFLYLFSYLCIAEALPVILILRLLF